MILWDVFMLEISLLSDNYSGFNQGLCKTFWFPSEQDSERSQRFHRRNKLLFKISKVSGTFSKWFHLKIDFFPRFLLGCRAFFKAQWKTSKIFKDAGKFYKIFPCMIPEFSTFFKTNSLHATIIARSSIFASWIDTLYFLCTSVKDNKCYSGSSDVSVLRVTSPK